MLTGKCRLLGVALAVLLTGSGAAAAQTSGIKDGQSYFIEAAGKSASCLTAENFLVLESHCFKKDNRQIFAMLHEPAGWRLVEQETFSCLQAEGEEMQVRQAECTGARAQFFELKTLPGGEFEIRSNKGHCLEVEDIGAADQAPVLERKCATSEAQLFRIPLRPKPSG